MLKKILLISFVSFLMNVNCEEVILNDEIVQDQLIQSNDQLESKNETNCTANCKCNPCKCVNCKC